MSAARCPTCGPRCTTPAHDDTYEHDYDPDPTGENADRAADDMERAWDRVMEDR